LTRSVKIGALGTQAKRWRPVWKIFVDCGQNIGAEIVRLRFERVGRKLTERAVSAGRGMPLQAVGSLARIEGKAGEIGVFGLLTVEKSGEQSLESILQHGKSMNEVAELLLANRCITPAATQHAAINGGIPQGAVAAGD
jgi:hypothetical protein